jgi:hypothetical protein
MYTVIIVVSNGYKYQNDEGALHPATQVHTVAVTSYEEALNITEFVLGYPNINAHIAED